MTDKPELVSTLTGYSECRCILSQYCDGKCRPIYELKPAAHLTIPGALEWDGDNGTHGVVGTHGADGAHSESAYDDAKDACAEIERAGAPGDVIREMNDELVDLRTELDDYKAKWLAKCEALKLLGIHARHAETLVKSCREKLEVDSVGNGFIEALDGFIGALRRDDNTHGESEVSPSAYTAVDMTTAAAGGFRDGQTTATDSLKAFANELITAGFEGGSFDGGDIQGIAVKHGLLQIEQRTEECGEVCACREYGFPAECYRKTELLKPAEIDPFAATEAPYVPLSAAEVEAFMSMGDRK